MTKDYRPADVCRGSGGFDVYRSQQTQARDLEEIREKIAKVGPWESAKLPSFLNRKPASKKKEPRVRKRTT